MGCSLEQSKTKTPVKGRKAKVQSLRSLGDRSLSPLVDLERGLVSREIYVNPDIYQQELEQI